MEDTEDMENLDHSDEVFAKLPITDKCRLGELKVCFCIDISGSTNNPFTENITVLDVEKSFVEALLPELKHAPKFIKWESCAHIVSGIDFLTPTGGTSPASILDNADTLAVVQECDVMIILTDGEIGNHYVTLFGKYMLQHATHLKAIIGVIVGRRTNRTRHDIKKPSEIDVSVLVPAMISNSCILFHNSNNTYIMWSGGVFKDEWKPADITNTIDWASVTQTNFQKMCNILIPIPDADMEKELIQNKYIPFGEGIYFNPENLLTSQLSWDQMLTLPFDRICQYFRVSQNYDQLLDWFKKQKDRFIQEFMIDSNEKDNVDQLIMEMSMDHGRQSNHTIGSYIQSRNRALARRYVDDNEIENLFSDHRIVRLIQLFRNILEVMEEDNRTQNMNATYTTASVSSTRYFTNNKQSISTGYATRTTCTSITVDFSEPYKWVQQFNHLYPNHASLKAECSICMENDTVCVIIRKPIDCNNINDLVDHATTYFYPQPMCSKCAGFFCEKGMDPVRVPCCVAIPLVNLVEKSSAYFFSSFMKITNCENKEKNKPSSTNLLLRWLNNITNNSNIDSDVPNLLFTITILCGLLKEYLPKEIGPVLDMFEKNF